MAECQKNMELTRIIRNVVSFLILALIIYVSACDDKAVVVQPPPPPGPNPYGEGNGKITFIRKQPIDGPVTIKISDKLLNDSIIWEMTPPCDTVLAASQILPAGAYTVKIQGDVFLCHYDITIEERVCKIQEYTNCSGGYTGCTEIDGVWLRTDDGPCPNCRGLKVEFRNGFGEVIYTPPGCRFALGDTKWKNFDLGGCNMLDLARDQYGGSPEYQTAALTFYDKNSFVINTESGTIPYSRIALTNDKKKSKNINRNLIRITPADSSRLQIAR
jgi:hypothetical protein